MDSFTQSVAGATSRTACRLDCLLPGTRSGSGTADDGDGGRARPGTPTYFDSLIDQPITSMRALHYPAINSADDAVDSNSLRAGAHSDYGTLTILRTDDVSGLQIQQPDGTWNDITPRADTFVVNLGDSIAQWTNDRWRSTVHRVAVTDTAPRQSFAFFHMANWDASIECLPTCRVDGEPPHHEPVQAGPWLMRKFTSTVT